MDMPKNRFKARLADPASSQIGFWCSLPGSYAAELLAGAGYDWILLDTEHSPTEVVDVLAQLQALAPYPVAAMVRPASNDAVLIKRLLDLGAQTLLIPYIQSRAEAQAAVAALHYPPRGIRGVSGLTRATRFGRVPDYATRAADELCLILQIETAAALPLLEDIATTPGVDGIFIGPADLAASMGHAGRPDHPDVTAAIEDAIARLRACGVPSGILTPDPAFAARCIALGTAFTAVGIDAGILARGAEALRAQFR